MCNVGAGVGGNSYVGAGVGALVVGAHDGLKEGLIEWSASFVGLIVGAPDGELVGSKNVGIDDGSVAVNKKT